MQRRCKVAIVSIIDFGIPEWVGPNNRGDNALD
jgi:hypothetical protein